MEKNNDYNEEPILYCTHCLSLYIVEYEGTDYCKKCGSTHIKELLIEDWEKLIKDNNIKI